LIFVLLSKG